MGSVLYQQGVTLVELMVAMTIGLFILGGVISVVLSAKHTYTLQDQQARIQENLRFALDQITSELRMVGYSACGDTAKVVSTVDYDSADDEFWMTNSEGIEGYDGNAGLGVSDFPVPFDGDAYIHDAENNAAKNSDMIILRRGENGSGGDLTITNHKANSAELDIFPSPHNIEPGTILIMADADCSKVAIFQHTGSNANKIHHQKDNSSSPGNCEKVLSGTDGASCGTGGIDHQGSGAGSFADGSKIMEFKVSGYYVGLNGRSVPALYKRSLSLTGAALTSGAQELVEGVERLQFRYGVDTNDDGVADRYLAANDVTSAQWGQVDAVRVQLQIRSIGPVHSEDTDFTYTDINGDNLTYSDRFARNVVTRTIALRNRGF